jgi:hypothetical protein
MRSWYLSLSDYRGAVAERAPSFIHLLEQNIKTLFEGVVASHELASLLGTAPPLILVREQRVDRLV